MKFNRYQLQDICTFIDYRGKTPPKTTSGIPLITAKIIKNGVIQAPQEYIAEDYYDAWMRRGIPSKGSVIITTEAPLGEVAVITTDEKLAFAQRIIVLEPNYNLVDNYYLYYALQDSTLKNRIQARQTGTTVSGIKAAELKKVLIDLPSIIIQKQISSVLRTLDDKIELNNRINENLEQQAFVLFDSFFPAISTGDKTIGEYIIPKRGKNLLSKNAVPGTVPVVAGGLEPATYHNVANTSAPVLTISASGANSGFVRLWNYPVWSSDSSFVDSTMTPYVYFWYVMLKKRQKEIYDSQTGSAQPHIYPQHIAVMPVAELDSNNISSYTEKVTPFFRMIGANDEENKRIVKIRDALLPKLMSGELDVSEVEF